MLLVLIPTVFKQYQVGVEAKSKESLLIEDLCLDCTPSFSVAPHRGVNLCFNRNQVESFLADCMFLCTVIIIPRCSSNENIDFCFF